MNSAWQERVHRRLAGGQSADGAVRASPAMSAAGPKRFRLRTARCVCRGQAGQWQFADVFRLIPRPAKDIPHKNRLAVNGDGSHLIEQLKPEYRLMIPNVAQFACQLERPLVFTHTRQWFDGRSAVVGIQKRQRICLRHEMSLVQLLQQIAEAS